MQHCKVCEAAGFGVNNSVELKDVVNPETGEHFEAYVCLACLRREEITRVTCRTFTNTKL